MRVHDEIIGLVKNAKLLCVTVEETSDFYRDLNFDSLEFIQMLLSIEEIYDIKFDLVEMDMCLRVDRLIEIVEKKLKGAPDDQTLVIETKE